MTSGGQCVMTYGAVPMLLLSVNSLDMHTLEVCQLYTIIAVILIHLGHLHVCTGGRAYSNAHFGAGSGPIFLDDVQCTSSANQLLECPSRPILSHNCLHSADAGVGCEGTSHLCLRGSLQLAIFCTSFLQNSTMCKWSAATGRRKHSK